MTLPKKTQNSRSRLRVDLLSLLQFDNEIYDLFLAAHFSSSRLCHCAWHERDKKRYRVMIEREYVVGGTGMITC
jgi:hypothetical protein